MGSKAFLLIILSIFLVISSEVASRKLAQSSITSLEEGLALPPIGGGLPGIGAPIATRGMVDKEGLLGIGAPIGLP
uniref:Uncharacterized protein n=1 Tax=Solanum lycopersicum TaxID=4081 RepID=A0A3Q7IAA4_SOLLC